MKEKIPATLFILTKDSAQTITAALESGKAFADILVCDGGSVDETRDIARSFGARIVPQDTACLVGGKIADFACVRNAGIAHASFDWILYIDSDETVSTALVEEIRSFLLKNPGPSIVRIPAGIVLDGTPIRYSSNYPGYQVRFFNRRAGSFAKPIHERFVPTPGVIEHRFSSPWYYYIESGTIESEYARDLLRDLPIYTTRYHGASFGTKAHGVYRALRSVCGILARGLANALFRRGKETYPLHLEWLRARYQWEILRTILYA